MLSGVWFEVWFEGRAGVVKNEGHAFRGVVWEGRGGRVGRGCEEEGEGCLLSGMWFGGWEEEGDGCGFGGREGGSE